MKNTKILYNGIAACLLFVLTLTLPGFAQTVIYQENCGTPSATTLIQNYSGWQNTAVLYTGNGTCDIRSSNASTNYGQASGGGNIMINDTVKWFQISRINTLADTNLSLYCGLRKTNSENGNNFKVEVSVDSITWSRLYLVDTLPTGTGSSGWYRVQYGNVPNCSNLHIRFSNQRTVDFRLDDITLISGTETTLETVTLPIFSPGGGTYYEPKNVEINTTTPGATIYYTMDGTTPSDSSNLYMGTLTMSSNATVKAIAYKSGMYRSEVATASYIIRDTSAVVILPFDISDNSTTTQQDITLMDGFLGQHLGDSYSDGSAKFESSEAGAAKLTAHLDSAPDRLSFELKGKNGGASPTGYEGIVMLISESPDNQTWTTVATLNSQNISVDAYAHFSNFSLHQDTRYIRWMLVSATKGNTQLNNIRISKFTGIDSTAVLDYNLKALSVYPNPTHDNLYIDDGGLDILSIRLYDLCGHLLQQWADMQKGTLLLTFYPSGTYILKITTTSGTMEKKIVKY